jgi:hypothetical protein
VVTVRQALRFRQRLLRFEGEFFQLHVQSMKRTAGRVKC